MSFCPYVLLKCIFNVRFNYNFNEMNNKEKQLSNLVLSKLEKYFKIHTEVCGKSFYTKKLYRIDAIIKPLESELWANKDIAFGIEFKSIDFLEDVGGKVNLMRQAVNYSFSEFDGYGRIPILLCPPPIFAHKETAKAILRFLGSLNIGLLGNLKTLRGYKEDNLAIIYNEEHLVWSEKFGVSIGKTQKFKFK